MPVYSKHPEYEKAEKDWEQIADCLAGQRTIKRKGERYLPKPNPEDESDANRLRYKAYKKRATFASFTDQTVKNLVGMSYAIAPVATVPDEMKPWLEDLDGSGVSAIQQSKKALSKVVGFSRAALWVDYPDTGGNIVTIADAEEGGIRPRIILLDAQQVINWRVEMVGAKSVLTLVVWSEEYIKSDDGFEAKTDIQYRVLRLVGGTYVKELWRKANAAASWQVVERGTPKDGQGMPWKEIPFTFIGAETNTAEIEKPLMLEISNLNLGHYRNSADYEEAVYMVGQPTPVLAGLTKGWVDDVLKGKVTLGSRSAIPLPAQATASLLQAAENTLPKEAMDQKESLMHQLGAKLVEKVEVAKTATEAGIKEASSTSVLAAACHNVSEAYGVALRWAAQYGDVTLNESAPKEGEEGEQGEGEEILFELNTDFAVSAITSEEINGVIALKESGLVTTEEARAKIKEGGIGWLDDEEFKDKMAEETEEAFQQAKKELDAEAEAKAKQNPGKVPPGATPPAPAAKPAA